MMQSIEKKGNRGGGGEEESQHFLTISRCSNVQRWNRGVGSIASGDVTSRIRNTKRILRRSLIEKKASIRISVAYSRWRRSALRRVTTQLKCIDSGDNTEHRAPR